MKLRRKCAGSRSVRVSGRSDGLKTSSVLRITSAPKVRNVRISNIDSRPASKQIEIAITENDSNVPVIHRMTRTMFCVCTWGSLGVTRAALRQAEQYCYSMSG